ncbi:MAG: 2-dehydro-3-deoxyphosphogluconate aldolase, partial [Lachnospiraceae bacterium]|nr:2-dehydro-3-deoxyphosphogluconate aldolase [Lachnospiraceae bacterium]
MNRKIEELKLVPVVVLQDEKDTGPVAKALIAGGLPVAEVTFRTAAAEASIRAISEACPQMLVGAGTVTNLEQAKKAVEAGAKFLVTPGFRRTVTAYAVDHEIPIFTGV